MISFNSAISFASDLIKIPGAPGAEGDVADRVLRELKSLKFDEAFTDDAGNVIGIVKGKGSAPAVMLSSHLDVVDIGEEASWEHPPYGGVIADGYLHGRGAMDIKGPLALQTYAAAHFVANRADCDVIVAHTVIEERGGWGMEHLMASGAVKPGAVIIGESTNGDVCIGHRGRAEVIIEVEGLAGHASAPERARNPVYALPQLIDALQRFAASLPSDPILGPSTLAPTALETLPRSRNVIPDRARVIVDWRVLPDMTPERAERTLRELAASIPLPDGCTVRVYFSTEPQHTYTGLSRDRKMFTRGFLMDPADPVVRTAASAATAHGLSPAVRPWTFATDGGHTMGAHGIPTIGFAPGEERFAHTNVERLELAAAEKVFDAYPAVVRAVAGALEGLP